MLGRAGRRAGHGAPPKHASPPTRLGFPKRHRGSSQHHLNTKSSSYEARPCHPLRHRRRRLPGPEPVGALPHRPRGHAVRGRRCHPRRLRPVRSRRRVRCTLTASGSTARPPPRLAALQPPAHRPGSWLQPRSSRAAIETIAWPPRESASNRVQSPRTRFVCALGVAPRAPSPRRARRDPQRARVDARAPRAPISFDFGLALPMILSRRPIARDLPSDRSTSHRATSSPARPSSRATAPRATRAATTSSPRRRRSARRRSTRTSRAAARSRPSSPR